MPFITSLTEHHAEVVSDTLKSEPCCLGVDEAGRGPVLGPMVYGIAYCPVARNKELKGLGMDDSKKLTAEQREGLFDKMKSLCEWLGWSVRSISPDDISGCMLQRSKYNLNELSHDAAIYLIQSALNRGVNVTEVYVDTVGSPEKYQQKLAQYFPGLKITVAKKADSLYPSVSAASIAAKVTRDLQLKNWQFQEKMEGKVDIEFGSGYPGDPLTKKWLLNNMDSVFGFPRLIRFSWQTCSDLLAKEAVTVVWPEDLEDEQHQGKSSKKQKQVKLSSLFKPKSTRQYVYGDLGLRHVKDF